MATEVIYRPLSEIRPNPKNPRKAKPEDIWKLAESIKGNPQFFEARPILLSDRTGEFVIIGGERRSEAAALLGMEDVPTILLRGLTEAQEDEIMIKDNTHAGVWDEEKLKNWGREQLQGWNVDGINWPKEHHVINEDEFENNEIASRCQKGDIWQLGEHRLMCGDSTKEDDVLSLMGGARKIDLALTDPPYGIDIVSHKVTSRDADRERVLGDWWDRKTFGKTVGDGLGIVDSNIYHKIKGDETVETARISYEIMNKICKNQIIFGGNYFTEFLPPKNCWLVWDKVNGESVFADVELAWTSYVTGARLYKWMWNGMSREGDRKSEGFKRIHPTQKPVGLFGKILEDFSKPGETVLDLFAGSGTIAIAAEQLGRIAYMMEYESFYCDVIISRWENFTGKQAIKI